MKIKIELDKNAILPVKSHATDAGFDLFLYKDTTLFSNQTAKLDTGVHLMIPENHVGLILPRSSTSLSGITVFTGVIDSGYTGSIGIICVSQNKKKLPAGTRIAQILVLPIPAIEFEQAPVSSLATSRGSSGYGSTGH